MVSYFSHDSNARNRAEILAIRIKYGIEGYGIFFAILERMRDESGYRCLKDYNVIAFDLRVEAEKVKSIVEDFGLFVFTEDGKYFYSESFNERMRPLESSREQRRVAGLKSAEKRKNQRPLPENSTTVERPLNGSCPEIQQIKVNEIKVNNSKEDILLEKESKEIISENEKTESAEPETIPTLQKPKEEAGKEKSSAKKEITVRFVPPTVEQVNDYCSERKNNINPKSFVDFYQSKGWKVGKNPMKDWQAAVRTWENNNRNSSVSEFSQRINGKPPNFNERENKMGRITQSQAEAFLNGN